MAALTANAARSMRNTTGMTVHTYTPLTSNVIYKHGMTMVSAVNKLMAAADSTTTRFAGIAVESSTGTFPVTGDGTRTVTVATNLEAEFVLETITKGNILAQVYCATDNDIGEAATDGPSCGVLTEWTSSTAGWVFLGRTALAKGT